MEARERNRRSRGSCVPQRPARPRSEGAAPASPRLTGAAASSRSSAPGSKSRSALTTRRGTPSGRSDFLQQFRGPSNMERKAQTARLPPLAAPVCACPLLHRAPRPCRPTRSPPRLQSVHEGRPGRPPVRLGGRVVAQTRVLPAQAPREARVPSARFHGSGQRVSPGAPLPRNLGTFPARPEAPHAPPDSLCSELPRRAPAPSAPLRPSVLCVGQGRAPAHGRVGLPGQIMVYNRCARKPGAHLGFLQEQMSSSRLTRPFHSQVRSEGDGSGCSGGRTGHPLPAGLTAAQGQSTGERDWGISIPWNVTQP